MQSMNQEWISMNQDGTICMFKCGKSSLPAMVHSGKLHESRCMMYVCLIKTGRSSLICQFAISGNFPKEVLQMIVLLGCHFFHLWNTRWWFQICFIFIPTWGRFPFWLIFFKLGWNRQLDVVVDFFLLFFPGGSFRRCLMTSRLWHFLDQAWKSRIMERRSHRMLTRRFEDVDFFCLSVLSCVCVCVPCFCCWKRRPLWKKKTLNTPWEHEQIIYMSFAGSNVSQVLCSSVFDRFLFHCGWVSFETMYLLCFAVLGVPVHPRRKNPKEKPCPGRRNPTLKPSCPERNDSKSSWKIVFLNGQF